MNLFLLGFFSNCYYVKNPKLRVKNIYRLFMIGAEHTTFLFRFLHVLEAFGSIGSKNKKFYLLPKGVHYPKLPLFYVAPKLCQCVVIQQWLSDYSLKICKCWQRIGWQHVSKVSSPTCCHIGLRYLCVVICSHWLKTTYFKFTT